MPSVSRAGEPPLQDLLRKLANDGVQWADAELALARSQTSSAVNRLITGLVLAFIAFAVLLAALVIAGFAGAVALAPMVGGQVPAALIVTAIFAGLTLILAVAAWLTLRSSRHVITFFERWSNEITRRA